MKYNKPTVDVLDDAVRLIQGGKGSPLTDPAQPTPNTTNNPNPPAYELDE